MNELQKDQITLETRVAGGVVILVLLLAFPALYVEPDHTDLNFSWTLLPRTSAILIGAGYTAGAYFFARLIAEKKWHRLQAGFLPITAFTICMFAATLLHWSRFHQGTFLFYLWTAIYAATPILVPFLWWRNRASASLELEEIDLRFPSPVRWTLGGLSAVGALLFLLAFIQPSLLISATPWKLTELTARVFSGWSMLTSLTIVSIAADGRWSAARILLQSAAVGLALTLLALPRMWNDLDPTNPMIYVFIAGLGVALVTLIVIHIWVDRRIQRRSSIIEVSRSRSAV